MAERPLYGGTLRTGLVSVDAANTDLDNPSGVTVFTVLTAATVPLRVEGVNVKHSPFVAGTSGANVMRFWLNDGVRNNLYKDLALPAGSTYTATARTTQVRVATPHLVLPPGYSLRVTLHTYGSVNNRYTVTARAVEI